MVFREFLMWVEEKDGLEYFGGQWTPCIGKCLLMFIFHEQDFEGWIRYMHLSWITSEVFDLCMCVLSLS